MGISRFFIDRPVFAWVIAIVIMLVGTISILTLPIEQYPSIAPPAVTISAFYPGASAQTLENSVTQVIEQQLTGLDHLLYFSSSSSSSGQVSITATFAANTNPDIAQVQVQNKLQQAIPLLPEQVQQQGITVVKARTGFLLVVVLSDQSGHYNNNDIADFLTSTLQDPLSRVPGVGAAQVFGSQYAMRIWLNPFKLAGYGLDTDDVKNAILAQNTQVSAGELGGQPTVQGQELNATVTAQSRLQTPDQFRNIILRGTSSGAVIHLSDVARVELGASNYGMTSLMNGHPAAGIAIQLAPGANALSTADAVKARAESFVPNLPPGVQLSFPVDNTDFIKLSIEQVIKTLVIALVLVVLVMYLFLQNWRTTLIPAIALPVVMLGTFGVLAAFGYTINTLTMFALVLAIGLLVDDAIVVIENVERVMREENLPPREATVKSMGEITGALVAIALVLSAVFLPMSFFGGSTGVIYHQFSITIVSAMILSITVALILTPALCATLLKPTVVHASHGRFFSTFNGGFARLQTWYRAKLDQIFHRMGWALLVYAVIVAAMVLLFLRLPTGFLPEEDQGIILTAVSLPAGAVQSRTLAVGKQIEQYFLTQEKKNVSAVFTIAGFSLAGAGQNAGLAFVRLKDWSVRDNGANSAGAIAQRATFALSRIRDAQIFALVPPAMQDLGFASGFDIELEDRGGIGHDRLLQAQNQLLGMAARDPLLLAVRPNSLPDTPQLHVDIDQAKADALGLSISDIDDTLSAGWGGVFINDFVDRGRVKRVYMQGDAPYRMSPESLDDWHVRSPSGNMAPFSSFATAHWTLGPAVLQRYNGLPSLEIQGSPASGISSGTATAEMEKLISQLPQGVGYELTGMSFQEALSGAQAPALYAISILVVYLCLSALYESWAVPVSVMLVIPLGVIGAILAATLRGLYNDIYFQVGLLTTIGLSSKNAILIVEFAEEARRRGVNVRDAALGAARLRLRPILMTSLAFIAGVSPLALATGAGAASQHDIGTGVVGGMITATILAVFLVPLFFLLVVGRLKRGGK